MKKSFAFLRFALLLQATTYALEKEEECDLGSRAVQITTRHSQGAGVGYGRGYTTLEAFLAPPRCSESWLPFIDLRGHIFNNRTFGANAGLGLRYINKQMAWGINSYYDYRQTKEFHYNQVGAGLEAIGPFWSANLNGYLPVGKKASPFFNPGISGVANAPSFAFFQGNQLFLTLSGTQGLVGTQEFAFKGLDANASFRLMKYHFFSLDCGLGSYYFKGIFHKYAAGGKASLTAHFSEYVALSVSGSYDNLFHLRAQGSLGISIPLGPRSFSKTCASTPPCHVPQFFDWQLARGADRAEIVVLDKHKKTLAVATVGGTEVAINPATGQPYFIWFVNNTSMSLGTFESPFPTLQQAFAVAQPNDIIYVYPGDGTPYDDAVTLLDGQMFLGSGVNQVVQTTRGPITIPALTATDPKLENTMGATIVTLANKNTLSGFELVISMAGDTIAGTSINGISFLNNTCSTAITGVNSLRLTDCFGTFLVQNNQFTMDTADTTSNGIVLNDGGTEISTLSVISNTFANYGSRAMTLSYTGTSSPTLHVTGNTFSAPVGIANTAAIDLSTSNGTILSGSISNQNIFSNYTNNVMNLTWDGSGAHTFVISNNSLSSDATVAGTRGISLNSNVTGASSITASGNQFSNQSDAAIVCTVGMGGTLTVAMNHNTIAGANAGGNSNAIQLNPANTASIVGSITSNTCTGHQGYGISGSLADMSQCSLTIANNTLTGLNGAANSRGISFFGNGSTSMNLNIHNNTLNNHTEQGIDIFVDTDAIATATVNQNTLTVPPLANSSGIRVSANNSSAATSTYTVTNNICAGHSNGNIQSFPQGESQLHLNISNNVLTSVADGVAGINPTGIQIGPGTNVAFLSLTVSGNSWTGPATYQPGTNPQGISLGIGGNATASNVVVSGNTAILPLTSYASMTGPVGITLAAFNTGNIAGMTVSNNTVQYPNSTYQADSSPNGIALNASDTAQLSGMILISSNTVTYAALNDPSLMNFNPQAIQVSSGNNGVSAISSLLIQNNTISQIGGQGINLFAGGSSTMQATVNNNHITATGAGNMVGISVSASDTTTSTYTITNNTCIGHTNGSIQSFPNGMAEVTLTVSGNTLIAATNGISSSSSVGVQFGPNGNCHILSATISGNTWTGPATYQSTGTPQGIQSGPNNNAIVDHLIISNNTIQFPLTSYQPMTSPQGIQVGAYNNAQLLEVDISNNSVAFLLASYVPQSGPQGIQLNTGNTAAVTDVTIFNNTVTFAPLTSLIMDIGLNGIQVGGGDDSILGTSMSPILVEQNTVTNVLTGIGSFVQSSQDSYVTVFNNTVSLGVSTNTNQLAFGISTGAQGTGKLVIDIDGNTIEGNNQGFFGVLLTNQSSVCQEATVQNNTISNVIGVNSPVPGAGGGIGAIPLGAGDFVNVLLQNNALSGNMPQGIMGIDSGLLGGSANLCIVFQNNHGVGMQPADGYTLFNPTMAPPSTFTYDDAGGNTGTFNFVPSMSDFTAGTCSPCP